MDQKKVTGRQIAAGRALLGKSQAELASEANVSVPTLKRMEANKGAVAGLANNVAAIRTVLETWGVIFIEQNSNGPGVRLRDPVDISSSTNLSKKTII